MFKFLLPKQELLELKLILKGLFLKELLVITIGIFLVNIWLKEFCLFIQVMFLTM